jgi:hypothetical protein
MTHRPTLTEERSADVRAFASGVLLGHRLMEHLQSLRVRCAAAPERRRKLRQDAELGIHLDRLEVGEYRLLLVPPLVRIVDEFLDVLDEGAGLAVATEPTAQIRRVNVLDHIHAARVHNRPKRGEACFLMMGLVAAVIDHHVERPMAADLAEEIGIALVSDQDRESFAAVSGSRWVDVNRDDLRVR